MIDKLISVIIPVYKAENTLKYCVRSILVQSYTNIEIILVDDGSPDKSGQIADELSECDSRISVFHIQNVGPSKARQYGYQHSNGEWLTFVDADDSLQQYALEKLASRISDNSDLIIAFNTTFNILDYKDYSLADYRRDLIRGQGILLSVWAKLYRSSAVQSSMFDFINNFNRGEDMIFNIRFAFHTQKAPIILPEFIYNYNCNPSGLTHTVVTTPDLEEEFYLYKLNAIPEEYRNDYIKELIDDRFHPIQRFSYRSMTDISWMQSSFFKHLVSDINRFHIHLKFRQKLFLNKSITRVPCLVVLRIIEHFFRK